MSLNRHELQRYNQAVLAVHATAVAAQFSANLLRALRLVASVDIAVVDWRGFGSGERLALGLLKPHIRSCWQRLRAQERLQAAVSADNAVQRLDALSEREREVLGWVGNGLRNRQIADLLGIRPATVKRHLENLYAKLGLDGRGEARRLLAAVEQVSLPHA